MSWESPIVSGIIGGGVVAVVNWLFRRADVRLARQEEHRQAYRNMLSYLIDLHSAVRIMSINLRPKVTSLLEEFDRQLSPHIDATESREIMPSVRPAIWNQMLTHMAGPFLSTIPDFKGAVSRLAPIDPIAAFHIRSQRNVMQIVEQFEQLVATSAGDEAHSPEVFEAMIERNFKPKMLEDVLEGLVDLIEEVGAHVEPVHLAAAREFMRREVDMSEGQDESDKKLVELLVQQILSRMPDADAQE